MKKHDFRVMDPGKVCMDCGAPLKQNLTDKNPQAHRCYKCHNKKKGRK